MKSRFKNLSFFVIIILFFASFYVWLSSSIKKQQQKDYSQELIQEAFYTADCTVAVKIKGETLTLKTGYQDIGVNCIDPASTAYTAKISPSKKFLAHSDLSGGVDPQLRVFYHQKSSYPTADVLFTYGPSVDYDYAFLPDDRLAVLYRYNGTEFPMIAVFNLPQIYSVYPQNVDSETHYLSINTDYVTYTDLSEKEITAWYIEPSEKQNEIRLLDKNKKLLAEIKLD